MKNEKNKKTLVILAVWLLISCLLLLMFQAHGYYDLGATVFFLLLVYVSLVRFEASLKLKCLLYISVISKLVYAFYLYSNSIILFPDTIGYFRIIDTMFNSDSLSLRSVIRYAGTLHVGYHYVALLVFKAFKTYFAIYMLSIYLFLLSVLMLKTHFTWEFGTSVGTSVFVFLCFSGFMFVFMSNVLKDPLVLFLSSFVLFMYSKFNKNNNALTFILILLGLVHLTLTRIYSGVALALAILVDIIISREIKISTTQTLFIIIAVLSVFLFTPLRAHFDMGIRFVKGISLSPSTLLTIMKSTISFFLSPFFWNMTSELTIYTPLLLDSIFFLVFSPLLINFFIHVIFKKSFRRRLYIYLIPIVTHILTLGIAYETGAVRQRIAVYPMVFIFYVLGLPRKKCENSSDRRKNSG